MKQSQQQQQLLQMNQELLRRFPVLEATRLSIERKLIRLARHNRSFELTFDPIDWVSDEAIGFEESLFNQISESSGTEDEKRLRRELVKRLDHRGFLVDSVATLAAALRASAEEIESARTHLLFLEPTGVGSRDETECQYRHALEHEDPNVLDVWELRHLEPGVIQERLGIDAATLKRVERTIALLPKQALREDKNDYVLPEAKVDWRNGRLDIQWYFASALVNQVEVTQEEKWWLDSLQLREQTLRLVITYIVNHQADWLAYGSSLRTLTRKQLARDINRHESTVGRAIKGKYIDTPHGLVALPDFFLRATKQGHSPALVKQRIAEWVRDEREPLSDQQLTDRLATQGIRVTRRTVRNYREALGIASYVERKKQGGGEAGEVDPI